MTQYRSTLLFLKIVGYISLAGLLTLVFSGTGWSSTIPSQPTVNILVALPDALANPLTYTTVPLTQQETSAVIDRFGLAAASVETDTAEIKRLASSEKTLIIHKKTGAYRYKDRSIVGSTQTISIATDTAEITGNTYLANKGLLTPELFLRRTGSSRIKQEQGQLEMTEFVLNYGDRLFDGETTVTAVGPGAKLLLALGQGNQVGSVTANMPKLQPIGSAPTINGAQAAVKLQAWPRNWNRVPPMNVSEINITSVTVAYYIPPTRDPTLIEPVYVFRGEVTDGSQSEPFLHLVPALAETNVRTLMDPRLIFGDEGGLAFDERGKVAANFSPGSFSGTMTVTVDETQSVAYPPPTGLVAYTPLYDFQANTAFDEVNIRFSADSAYDVSASNIYRWTDPGWQNITSGRVVDGNRNAISALVDHFTVYGVFGPAPPSPPTGVNVSIYLILALLSLSAGSIVLRRRIGPRGVYMATFAVILIGSMAVAQNSHVLADPKKELYTSGVDFYNNDNGCGWSGNKNLANAVEDARGFGLELVTSSKDFSSESFEFFNDDAWASDWEPANDQLSVDRVDIAYFSGHSGIIINPPPTGWAPPGWHPGYTVRFGVNNPGSANDCTVEGNSVRWGDETADENEVGPPGVGGGDLEVVALAGCNNMDGGASHAINYWRSAFRGVHQIVGFVGTMKDVPNMGVYFAQSMNGTVAEETVWEAWKWAAEETHGFDETAVAMVYRDIPDLGINSHGDHLVGHGSVSRDFDPMHSRVGFIQELSYKEYSF